MPATEQRVSLPPRYRVVRHIANGGMASVWAAEDQLLGRLVAVKLLSRAYDTDDRPRKRFLREARAAAKLGDCRHVVTVYDIGEHDDRAFIVMEHFSGGTLADRLKAGPPIPRPLAVRWLHEAAIALDCAHEHDVVHRDVKPANLLLDGRGRLAVGDFGIATVASEASVTLTGQVLGTAAYISPEQARGNPATAASDRYALAVVAYELLTGRRPFAADHPAAQARQHVEATVPAASAAASGLPKAVDAVLAAGLAKDPSDRPATAAELVERLEDALGGDAEPADPPTAATQAFTPVAAPPPARRREPRVQRPATPPPARPRGTTSSRPVPPPRRSWGWLAALAALLLAAGAVAAIAMTSGGSGGSGDGSDRAAERTTSRSGTATSERRRTQSTQSTPAASTPAQGTSSTPRTASTASTPRAPASADPKQLNDRGFAMLQQGDAAGAVQPLQQSVAAFRSQGRRGEIDYAFALYNLGNALRRSGKPGDAIPFLEERLKVSDYKRGVVQRELALARQQAGQGGSGAAAPAAAQPGKAAKAPRAERKDNSGPGNADDGGGDD
jgi:eukaryotic-like serine/threonine-protein kinase